MEGRMATKTAMAQKTVRIPISNIPAAGDYTAQILVGSQNVPANVILDTGSSSLAIKHSIYKPSSDKNLKATPYAQDVTYGTGGWAGPVVITSISMGPAGNSVTLQNSPMAIADDQEPHNFGRADGILGLAYNVLNGAFNLAPYLQQRNINPAVTYPWPFPVSNSSAVLDQLGQLFNNMQQVGIPPYFDELEQNGITANKFAFYTLRSVPSMAGANHAANPLNKGVFVLGGGEEESDLYTGTFSTVNVVADDWYNTDLNAIQVGNAAPIPVAALTPAQRRQNVSNSIVDSGTNALFVTEAVFQAIMNELNKLNPQFVQQALTALKNGIPSSDLDLSKWPGISLILAAASGPDVKLTCTPQTYWQLDAPKAGQAMFQIVNGNMPQSILGLPLMNNYYTVFDRSVGRNG